MSADRGVVVEEILLNYGLPGVIILAMGAVIARLYADGKIKDLKLEELSQARVNDLKEINNHKESAGEQIAQMVRLIYDKLESEKRSR